MNKGVEISLRTESKIGPHFEIELMADEDQENKAKQRLLKIAKELGLSTWNREEYEEVLETRKQKQ